MYASIDIETTGLDPETCQVLEIAVVLDDRSKRVVDCPAYCTPVRHRQITGSPYALCMNSELLGKIAASEGEWIHVVGSSLRKWLNGRGADKRIITPLGKNIGSFDWQFLKRIPEFPTELFGYRMLDIGSLYATADGMRGQDDLCDRLAEEFGIPGKPHEALYDARVSLALARAKWGIEV